MQLAPMSVEALNLADPFCVQHRTFDIPPWVNLGGCSVESVQIFRGTLDTSEPSTQTSSKCIPFLVLHMAHVLNSDVMACNVWEGVDQMPASKSARRCQSKNKPGSVLRPGAMSQWPTISAIGWRLASARINAPSTEY